MHPELESEQAYVDHAYACLEEMRRQVERAGEAGIGRIADGGVQGLRALYVALTRPTKTLVVVHAEPLPEPLLPA